MLTVVFGDGTTLTENISLFDAVVISMYVYSGRVKLAVNKIEEWISKNKSCAALKF